MLNNINKIFNHIIYNDVAEPWQIGFQDGAAPNFTGIVELHNNIFFFLIVILIGVSWMLGTIIYFYNSHHNSIVYKYLNHGTIIETIWTITPALILIAIAFPSFRLLYLMDEVISPTITIKVTGNQWFWSYEYSDYVTESGDSIEFDSYMVPESDLELGQFRLLETDNHVIIPTDTHIRLIVTAADVLHDYAVPSLGIKIDACPGRLNQASLLAERTGTFYGQCSEICGVYHGFMPTVIEAVSTSDYLNWIDSVSITFLSFSSLTSLRKFSVLNYIKSFFTFYKIKKIFILKNIVNSLRNIHIIRNTNNYRFTGKVIYYFDLILIFFIISSLVYDITLILSSILNFYFSDLDWSHYICYMNNNASSSNSHSTNVTIVHNDGTWSNSIRQIFIYGTGALRLTLLKSGGTPITRSFVIASTLAVDVATRALTNSLNDPTYVRNHVNNWKQIWKGNEEVSIDVSRDKETIDMINNISKKFIPDNLNELYNNLLNNIINVFKNILEPVSVSYSNELLSDQIYGISILLFILSILIIILFLSFILNILLLIYSDKILSYFTNKYIRWYIIFNKKIIGIEVFLLSFTLLYSMIYMSYGIHFIATHPIQFN